jgi:hypothetical protein
MAVQKKENEDLKKKGMWGLLNHLLVKLTPDSIFKVPY